MKTAFWVTQKNSLTEFDLHVDFVIIVYMFYKKDVFFF